MLEPLAGDVDWAAYQATSASGYNLTLIRVTGTATSTLRNLQEESPDTETNTDEVTPIDTPLKKPLLLLHGMFSEPFDWLKKSEGAGADDKCLASALANAGYDVWIGVSRGRQYSDTHASLQLDTDEGQQSYWDYTFDNVGREDITAMVDEII